MKKKIEKRIHERYPNVNIEWKGDDFKVIIPDELADRIPEVIAFVMTVFASFSMQVDIRIHEAVVTK